MFSLGKFKIKSITKKSKSVKDFFKKINKKNISKFSKVLRAQIVYYIKSNKKIYKKFITNFGLSSVASWTSKLSELARVIAKLLEELNEKKKKEKTA